jgi:phage-related baseplate assembly protein
MKEGKHSSVVLLAASLIMVLTLTPGCNETEKKKPTSDPQAREANETLDDIIKNTDRLLIVIQGVVDGDSAQKAQAEVKELIGKIKSLTSRRNAILRQQPELARSLFVAANAGHMLKQVEQIETQVNRLRGLPDKNPATQSVLDTLLSLAG